MLRQTAFHTPSWLDRARSFYKEITELDWVYCKYSESYNLFYFSLICFIEYLPLDILNIIKSSDQKKFSKAFFRIFQNLYFSEKYHAMEYIFDIQESDSESYKLKEDICRAVENINILRNVIAHNYWYIRYFPDLTQEWTLLDKIDESKLAKFCTPEEAKKYFLKIQEIAKDLIILWRRQSKFLKLSGNNDLDLFVFKPLENSLKEVEQIIN